MHSHDIFWTHYLVFPYQIKKNLTWSKYHHDNPSRPSVVYMDLQTGPYFVQTMACRLFRAKPLCELMLAFLMGPLLTNFSETWIKLHQLVPISMCLKINLVCKITFTLSQPQYAKDDYLVFSVGYNISPIIRHEPPSFPIVPVCRQIISAGLRDL